MLEELELSVVRYLQEQFGRFLKHHQRPVNAIDVDSADGGT